jgi:putative ABC transport system ATP-binding protein
VFPPSAERRVEPREPLVSIRGVSKDYVSGAGVVRALREVDLVIEKGEFVAIVGTSGSGKSTLMNILGCLDRPTHGGYDLAGIEVGGRSNDGRALVRNRLIGFIFQGFNLLPRTTALENVELPLQYRGVARSVRRKRAIQALEQVGLGDRMHHTPNQLSGGQQQRVAIARALVTDPPLLLADEPTGNLDTRTSLEVLALLQKLNREVGVTICLVTHERDIAACASRVITVRDGRIVTDERAPQPLDAAAAVDALPTTADDAGPVSVSAVDPRQRLRQWLGGPVPLGVYAAMAAGGLAGAGLGWLYDSLVLGQRIAWVPLVVAAFGEAWVGARYGARRVGHPLTPDQRVRVAIAFTCAVTLPLAAVLTWFLLPRPFVERIEQLSSAGIALALVIAVLAVLATALLRYLLLAIFAPRRMAPASL